MIDENDRAERLRCTLRHVATLGGPLELRATDELPSGHQTGDHPLPSVGHLAILHSTGGAEGTHVRLARARARHQTPHPHPDPPRVGDASGAATGGGGSEETDESGGRTNNTGTAATASKSGGHLRPLLKSARSISSPDLLAAAAVATGSEDAEPNHQVFIRDVVDRLLICDTANLRVKLVEVVRVQRYRCDQQDPDADEGESSSESYHLHVQLASDTTGWPCASAQVASGRLAVLETIRDPLKNAVKLIVSIYHSQRTLTRRLVSRPSVDGESSSCALCRAEPGHGHAPPPVSPAASTTPPLQHQCAVNMRPHRSGVQNTGSTEDLVKQMLMSSLQPEYDEALLCEGDAAWVGGVHLVPSSGRLLVSALAFEHLFELVPDYAALAAAAADPYRGLHQADPHARWGLAISGSSGSVANRICWAAARAGAHIPRITRPFFKSVAAHEMPEMLFDFAQNDNFFVVLYSNSKVCIMKLS